MKSKINFGKVIAAGTILACAGAAGADTITAKYTSQHGKGVNLASGQPITGNVNTVKFNWTRQDAPGMGVDSLIGSTFSSYCVDMSQYVSSNTDYTFDVLSPADAGYTDDQTLMLRRLWGEYFDDVTGGVSSAAFQLAVWEIVFDTGTDVGAGAFVANSPTDSRSLAQSWLTDVSSSTYSGGVVAGIAVLRSATAQDQITAVSSPVPAPGAGSLATIGFALMAGRRKRTGLSPR